MPNTKKLSGKSRSSKPIAHQEAAHSKTLQATPVNPKVKGSTSETPATVVATKTLASLPPLTSTARAAFLAQTTTQERADLGARTKSAGVLRDAGAWVPVIAKHRDKTRYGANRLAFLCESILVLADAIAVASSGRTSAASAGAVRNGSVVAARTVRDEIVHALEQVTRGSAEAARVAEASRGAQRDDELAASLSALADLADAFLAKAKKDAGAAALAEGASLTAADVTAARSAAAALIATGAARVTAGSARVQDTPEVNLAEGTVLAEMRVARRAFELANASDPTVPRLTPGDATRSVLVSHPKGKAGASTSPAAPPSSTAPPTSAASPNGTATSPTKTSS